MSFISISFDPGDSDFLGEIFTWGSNNSAKTGLNTTTGDTTTRTKIGTNNNWNAIAASTSHSLAVRSGTLWAWGSNANGRTGLATATGNTLVPTQVGSSSDWERVSNGDFHSLALKADGTLWSWGLSTGTGLGFAIPIFIANLPTGGTSTTSPTQIGSANNWTDFSAGGLHSLGIRSGEIYAWGINGNGQLGDGTTTNRTSPVRIGSDSDWYQVSAGYRYSLAIKTDGTLWGWGINSNGQLGQGNTTQRTSPIQIGTSSDWSFISAGGSHAVGIGNGEAWAWGNNTNGRTGLGTTTGNTLIPTKIGTDDNWDLVSASKGNIAGTLVADGFSLAIRNGTLWAWGLNANSQLGDGSTTNTSSPTQIGTNDVWASISAGFNHSLAIRRDT